MFCALYSQSLWLFLTVPSHQLATVLERPSLLSQHNTPCALSKVHKNNGYPSLLHRALTPITFSTFEMNSDHEQGLITQHQCLTSQMLNGAKSLQQGQEKPFPMVCEGR